MFKIKDGDKLELQTPQTMKLFDSIKKSKEKTKTEENIPNYWSSFSTMQFSRQSIKTNVWCIIYF